MPREIPRRDQEIRAIVAGVLLLIAGSGAASAAEADAVARGAYLAAAAGCDQCHTDGAHGGAPYAGGRRFSDADGTVISPNITPDPATGIGAWSDRDFVRAMRWGIAPDDSHYLPIFPFPFFNALSDGDLVDLKAFLDSLPAVSRPDQRAAEGLSLVARAGAAVMVAATAFAGPWHPDPARDPVWNRGAYLVATVGRCADCHSPHKRLGVRDADAFLAGTTSGPGGKKVPNITPDQKTGIGKWSEGEIAALLTDGETPEFDFVGGAMAEIVKNTARLTDADRRAIAAFVKSVPAKPFAGKE